MHAPILSSLSASPPMLLQTRCKHGPIDGFSVFPAIQLPLDPYLLGRGLCLSTADFHLEVVPASKSSVGADVSTHMEQGTLSAYWSGVMVNDGPQERMASDR
jgi:hypothetical protein